MSNFRKKMGKKRSKKLFTKTAVRVKKQNMRSSPMRGGYRI